MRTSLLSPAALLVPLAASVDAAPSTLPAPARSGGPAAMVLRPLGGLAVIGAFFAALFPARRRKGSAP